jgi:hypothetical protein
MKSGLPRLLIAGAGGFLRRPERIGADRGSGGARRAPLRYRRQSALLDWKMEIYYILA